MTLAQIARGGIQMCNEEIRSEEEQEGPAPSLVSGDGPLIFIAHDSRDAELAEAFSELLKAVSVGLLRSFRSSDQKGTEGIEYGQQWFPEIMGKLERATQVVCLLTRRSLDRPWILYEAGVATGKASTRVHGLALGIPFSRVNTGPFAQFQNCDGSNLESVTKLIMELMEQIPGADPQPDTLRPQVEAFLETAAGIMQSAEEGDTSSEEEVPVDEAAVARLFEEIKGMFQDLPSRVQGMLEESLGPAAARRRRRFHPMLLEDLTMQAQDDPSLAWLMLMGFVRDEVPWV